MITLARALGQRPDAFDGFVEVVACRGAQCVAQDAAEEAHVITEWLMGIVWHEIMG